MKLNGLVHSVHAPYVVFDVPIRKTLEANKMAHQLKGPAAKPDDLGLIPRTHTEG